MKLISLSYTELSLESLYSNLKNELLPLAEVQGNHNGYKNKPGTMDEFRVVFINKVQLRLQEAIDTSQSILLPISGAVIAKKYLADAEAEIKPLQASLEDTELDLRTLQEQKKGYVPSLQKKKIRNLIYAGAAIIAVAEGIFAFGAFRQQPLPAAASFISAVAITVALGFGTHFLAGYLKKAITRKQFFIRLAITTIPVFIGFCMLGNLRAKGYALNANLDLNGYQGLSEESAVSGIAITILSFLLFAAALLFSCRFYRTPQEDREEADYGRCCEALSQCEGKRKAITNEIEGIRENARQQSALALARYEYALAMEQRLISLGKRAVQEYIHKNIRHRSDTIPSFFSEPPQMHFRLFFDNVKKHKS